MYTQRVELWATDQQSTRTELVQQGKDWIELGDGVTDG